MMSDGTTRLALWVRQGMHSCAICTGRVYIDSTGGLQHVERSIPAHQPVRREQQHDVHH